MARYALILLLLTASFAACGFDGLATSQGTSVGTDAGRVGDPSLPDANPNVPIGDGGCADCDAATDAPVDAADAGDDAVAPIIVADSLLSPSNATGSLAFQRPIDWTLAASTPSTFLFYTTDGSTPTTASPSAMGQVTLPALADGTRIQWLVGADPAVHTFDAHVQGNLSGALHAIIENVTFQGTGSPWKTTTAGTKVTGTADYQVWSQTSCPSCIDQVTVGIAKAEDCLVNAVVGTHAGRSGTAVTFQITAPNAPGTYPVRMGVVQQLNCTPGAAKSAIGSGLSSTVIGAIIVK